MYYQHVLVSISFFLRSEVKQWEMFAVYIVIFAVYKYHCNVSQPGLEILVEMKLCTFCNAHVFIAIKFVKLGGNKMIIIFWEMTPCGSYKNQRFGGSYRLHLQGARVRAGYRVKL
jgi:hypothetical protein